MKLKNFLRSVRRYLRHSFRAAADNWNIEQHLRDERNKESIYD
ncbi:MAG: hypothetical protein PHH77_10920 [Victivallaceae bacterium]|nr:hypothetical protein [Victivallaceae bacterium]